MTTTINSKELALLEQELSLRNYELNQFVYHVSHDLMAPLCRIKGLLELVVKERPVGHHNLLSHVKHCIDQLSQFTSSTLAYSENLNTKISREPIVVADLVNEVFDRYQGYYPDSQMQLEFQTNVTTVHSDLARWRNILEVLFSNAFRFRDPNKSCAFVRVRFTLLADLLQLEFSDNGVGIPKSYHKQIMDIFFRGANSQSNGLGLYVLQQITNSLEGWLYIESEENKYTQVKLNVPVKPPHRCLNEAKTRKYTDATAPVFY